MKAFPHADYMKTNDDVVTKIKYLEQGMDLRDYFAAKAIINGAFSSTTNAYDSITAKRAYEIADAMIKQREETK